MPESTRIVVNGEEISTQPGATIAAVLASRGIACRRSVTGDLRGPLCGMGICYECRVEINGIPNCRSCQTICEPGMEVSTGGG